MHIIVSYYMYDALTGETVYTGVYPILKENADNEAFEAWLDDWCKENPGTNRLSYRQFDV
ncbi:MAG: hypothetical protein HFE90_06640 [Firmicutes bacterium]|nr:hypothetical protein [Bacillota bacterium]